MVSPVAEIRRAVDADPVGLVSVLVGVVGAEVSGVTAVEGKELGREHAGREGVSLALRGVRQLEATAQGDVVAGMHSLRTVLE